MPSPFTAVQNRWYRSMGAARGIVRLEGHRGRDHRRVPPAAPRGAVRPGRL